jgi:hypothetical protein
VTAHHRIGAEHGSTLWWVTWARTQLNHHGFAIVALFALALLPMYSIVLDPRSRIIGWGGDNIQYAYMTGWFAQALVLGQNPLVDPRLNYPDSLLLAATDAPWGSMLAVVPATLALGPTFGYNAVLYLGYALSGLVVYLWLYRLTRHRFAAFVAGCIFVLMPYRVAHSYGHPFLVSTQALVLFFWALDYALQPPQPGWRKLLTLGVATFLVGITSQYYLLIAGVTGAVYALLTLRRRGHDLLRDGWRWIVVVLGGALTSASGYLAAWTETLFVPYNVQDTRGWSAHPLDFVVPSRLHPFWGAAVERWYARPTWIEHTLYLGIVALVLAAIAVCWRGSPHRQRMTVWVGTSLTSLVLALGTDLHLSVNGDPLQADNPFWLPAYYLAHLPFMDLMRVWARFGVVAMLFVALLAGIGVSYLMSRFHRWRWSIGGLCLLLVILDMVPGRVESTPLDVRPIDRWLAAQPGDFAVAFLPPGRGNYEAMFGSLYHGKHLPAYNHPQHLPAAFKAFAQRGADFPNPDAIEALRAMGLRYLVVDRRFYDQPEQAGWRSVETILQNTPTITIVADIAPYSIIALNERVP